MAVKRIKEKVAFLIVHLVVLVIIGEKMVKFKEKKRQKSLRF